MNAFASIKKAQRSHGNPGKLIGTCARMSIDRSPACLNPVSQIMWISRGTDSAASVMANNGRMLVLILHFARQSVQDELLRQSIGNTASGVDNKSGDDQPWASIRGRVVKILEGT